MPDNQQFTTYRDGASGYDEHDAMRFVVKQMLARLRTCTPCQVVKVYNTGGLAPIGYVDVQPLVQQTDGIGENVTDLPILYGVQYFRLTGGTNGIIMDPAVGDIGMVCFSDRDISSVVATQAKAPPGSNRRHSLSDGFYFGSMLSQAAPTQYIQFNANGITITSNTSAKVVINTQECDVNATSLCHITSPTIKLDGNVEVTGTSKLDGAVTAKSTITATGEVKSGSIGLQAHHHTAQGATAPTTAAQA